jgi:transcriptional regulator with XRE-family HTH domain
VYRIRYSIGMATVISNEKALENAARNMRSLLEKSGMSLRELARTTGDSPMTLSNILNAKHVPGVSVLARVAEAFGVTIDDLLKSPDKNR